MNALTSAALGLAALAAAGTAHAQSGLVGRGIDLEPAIQLSVGMPIAEEPYELEAGQMYRLDIVSDGSAELALVGSDFFRSIWVNEVIINGIEVRPFGLESLEFDDPGTATLSFVPVRGGTYTLRVPGSTSEALQATFVIE